MSAHTGEAVARVKESKQSDYERFRDELYGERGIPSGMMGRWTRHIEIDRRFEAFLRVHYTDEITMMKDIAPDYLQSQSRLLKDIPRRLNTPTAPTDAQGGHDIELPACHTSPGRFWRPQGATAKKGGAVRRRGYGEEFKREERANR